MSVWDEIDRLVAQQYGPVPGLYHALEPGNVDLANRPRVKNPAGGYSSVLSGSYNIDGRETLLPHVSDDGKILTGDEAVEQYRRLGIYGSPDEATATGKRIHEQQEATPPKPLDVWDEIDALVSTDPEAHRAGLQAKDDRREAFKQKLTAQGQKFQVGPTGSVQIQPEVPESHPFREAANVGLETAGEGLGGFFGLFPAIGELPERALAMQSGDPMAALDAYRSMSMPLQAAGFMESDPPSTGTRAGSALGAMAAPFEPAAQGALGGLGAMLSPDPFTPNPLERIGRGITEGLGTGWARAKHMAGSGVLGMFDPEIGQEAAELPMPEGMGEKIARELELTQGAGAGLDIGAATLAGLGAAKLGAAPGKARAARQAGFAASLREIVESKKRAAAAAELDTQTNQGFDIVSSGQAEPPPMLQQILAQEDAAMRGEFNDPLPMRETVERTVTREPSAMPPPDQLPGGYTPGEGGPPLGAAPELPGVLDALRQNPDLGDPRFPPLPHEEPILVGEHARREGGTRPIYETRYERTPVGEELREIADDVRATLIRSGEGEPWTIHELYPSKEGAPRERGASMPVLEAARRVAAETGSELHMDNLRSESAVRAMEQEVSAGRMTYDPELATYRSLRPGEEPVSGFDPRLGGAQAAVTTAEGLEPGLTLEASRERLRARYGQAAQDPGAATPLRAGGVAGVPGDPGVVGEPVPAGRGLPAPDVAPVPGAGQGPGALGAAGPGRGGPPPDVPGRGLAAQPKPEGAGVAAAPDNPYLRMPLERVRADAANGVALAQEALRSREAGPASAPAQAAQPPAAGVAQGAARQPGLLLRTAETETPVGTRLAIEYRHRRAADADYRHFGPGSTRRGAVLVERRYIRDGVVESWEPFDLVASTKEAASAAHYAESARARDLESAEVKALRARVEAKAQNQQAKEAAESELRAVMESAQADYEAELKRARLHRAANAGTAPSDKVAALKAMVAERWKARIEAARNAVGLASRKNPERGAATIGFLSGPLGEMVTKLSASEAAAAIAREPGLIQDVQSFFPDARSLAKALTDGNKGLSAKKALALATEIMGAKAPSPTAAPTQRIRVYRGFHGNRGTQTWTGTLGELDRAKGVPDYVKHEIRKGRTTVKSNLGDQGQWTIIGEGSGKTPPGQPMPLPPGTRDLPQPGVEPPPVPLTGRPLARRVGGMSVEMFDITGDAKDALAIMSQEAGAFTDARRMPMTLEQIRGLASDLAERAGVDPEKIAAQFHALPESMVYMRHLVEMAHDDYLRAGEAFVANRTPENYSALELARARRHSVNEQTAGASSEVARALRIHQDIVRAQSGPGRAVRRVRDQVRLEREFALEQALPPELRSSTFNEMAAAPTGEAAYMAWMSNMLTAIPTHVSNFGGSGIMQTFALPEKLLASGLGSLENSLRRASGKGVVEQVAPREALLELMSAFEAVPEAAQAFAATWATGVDPFGTVRDAGTFLTRRKTAPMVLRVASGDYAGVRLVAATDAAWKAVAYRGALRSLGHREAVRQGLATGTPQYEAFLQRAIADPKTVKLQASQSRQDGGNLHDAAVEQAKYYTYNDSSLSAAALRKGEATLRAGDWYGKAAAGVVRVLTPFANTGARLADAAVRRGALGPLSVLHPGVLNDLAKGGVPRQMALSRLALGNMVAGYFVKQALDGKITGGGPKDPDDRAVLYSFGWQPYSKLVGDEYVSFSRFDPIATMMGLPADFVEVVHDWKGGKLNTTQLAARIAFSISNNLSSKTFWMGINNFVSAERDPEQFGERFIKGQVGSLVPALSASIAQSMDPVARETATVMDTLRSRIPGLRKDLPVKRDPIGGGKIRSEKLGWDILSPIYVKQLRANPVAREMARLGEGITRPPREVDGVELTPKQYETYSAIQGGVFYRAALGVVRREEWATLEPDRQRELLDQAKRYASDRARTFYRQSIGADLKRSKPVTDEQSEEMGGYVPEGHPGSLEPVGMPGY